MWKLIHLTRLDKTNGTSKRGDNRAQVKKKLHSINIHLERSFRKSRWQMKGGSI